MSCYKVVSVGDKLKNLREKYNVKQDDLAGKDITRNLISQIEHNKANLTRSSAEIMLKNLKKICDKKHIKIDENIDYLLESEENQASKILDIYIKELKDLSLYKDTRFVSKLKEVESFLVTWNLVDKKIILFELVGDYYFNSNDLYNSSVYYEKAKALMNNNIYSENIVSILRKLSMVYYYMEKYDNDIECCQFAINNFKNLNTNYYCIFLFNSAACYIELKKYKHALENLKILEPIVKSINMNKYYEVLTQEGVCLAELHEYEKSLNIYNKVLEIMSKTNLETYLIILNNITEIYIKLKDLKKAEKYLKILMAKVEDLDKTSKRISSIYYYIGYLCTGLNDIKNAVKYYNTSLDYAKKFRYYNLTIKNLSNLFDIYYFKKDAEEIENIKQTLLLVIGKEGKINIEITTKLIDYYLKMKDLETLNQIYNFVKIYLKGCGDVVFKEK